jgi:hypothetical protein
MSDVVFKLLLPCANSECLVFHMSLVNIVLVVCAVCAGIAAAAQFEPDCVQPNTDLATFYVVSTQHTNTNNGQYFAAYREDVNVPAGANVVVEGLHRRNGNPVGTRTVLIVGGSNGGPGTAHGRYEAPTPFGAGNWQVGDTFEFKCKPISCQHKRLTIDSIAHNSASNGVYFHFNPSDIGIGLFNAGGRWGSPSNGVWWVKGRHYRKTGYLLRKDDRILLVGVATTGGPVQSRLDPEPRPYMFEIGDYIDIGCGDTPMTNPPLPPPVVVPIHNGQPYPDCVQPNTDMLVFDVISTEHTNTNNGLYYAAEGEQFNMPAGVLWIVQGNHRRNGNIIGTPAVYVYGGINGGPGTVHGRYEPYANAAAGDWQVGDQFEFKCKPISCEHRTLTVTSIDHNSGNNGQYFHFNPSDIGMTVWNPSLGNTWSTNGNWYARGRHYRKSGWLVHGDQRVWLIGTATPGGAHQSRADPTSRPGEWEVGDTFELACGENALTGPPPLPEPSIPINGGYSFPDCVQPNTDKLMFVVISTEHTSTNNGQYFATEGEDFRMVWGQNWVVQGDHRRNGHIINTPTVLIAGGANGGPGTAHGRYEAPTPFGAGNWQVGDTFEFKCKPISCQPVRLVVDDIQHNSNSEGQYFHFDPTVLGIPIWDPAGRWLNPYNGIWFSTGNHYRANGAFVGYQRVLLAGRTVKGGPVQSRRDPVAANGDWQVGDYIDLDCGSTPLTPIPPPTPVPETPAPETPAPTQAPTPVTETPTTPSPQLCSGACLYGGCVQPNQLIEVSVLGAVSSQVWGTGPFTDDSHVGASAVLAGKIAVGETKVLTVRCSGAQSSFSAGSANGVDSQSYGPWGASYTFDLDGVTLAPNPPAAERCFHEPCALNRCRVQGTAFSIVVTGSTLRSPQRCVTCSSGRRR